MNETDELIRKEDVAKILNAKLEIIEALIAKGDLPAVVIGDQVFVYGRDLDELLGIPPEEPIQLTQQTP